MQFSCILGLSGHVKNETFSKMDLLYLFRFVSTSWSRICRVFDDLDITCDNLEAWKDKKKYTIGITLSVVFFGLLSFLCRLSMQEWWSNLILINSVCSIHTVLTATHNNSTHNLCIMYWIYTYVVSRFLLMIIIFKM